MLYESLKQIGLKESGILCEDSIGMPVGVHRDSSRVSFGFFFQEFLIENCHELLLEFHQYSKVLF